MISKVRLNDTFDSMQDDIIKKAASADSLYDKSETSSPLPPSSENGDKIF